MNKKTKILITIFTLLVVCAAGVVIGVKVLHDRLDARFFERVSQIKVGMSFSQVKEILPYRIHRTCIDQEDIKLWADTKDAQIINNCHLYYLVDDYAMRYILVYVDKQNQTVLHVSTQHQ